LLEKESSGMYFSGHLIDSYDRHVKFLEVKGIAELLSRFSAGDVREKEIVMAAGIVSAVTVKTTRKNEKMAFVTIEDRYGSIECLVFPNVYQKVAHLLRIEAPLAVRGNLSVRDEEDSPKILVADLEQLIENERFTPPERPKEQEKKERQLAIPSVISQKQEANLSKKVSKLYLRLPDLVGTQYAKAKNLLEIFDGETPVIFYDTSKASYVPYGAGASVDAFLLSELCALLGKENVVAR